MSTELIKVNEEKLNNGGFMKNMGDELWCFFSQNYGFLCEPIVNVEIQMLMTQEIFNLILDWCMSVGSRADKVFYRMLIEYSDYLPVYADALERKIDKDYPDLDFPDFTPIELQVGWNDLCRRIRELYGYDVI